MDPRHSRENRNPVFLEIRTWVLGILGNLDP